jgi:replicative DNA helicase
MRSWTRSLPGYRNQTSSSLPHALQWESPPRIEPLPERREAGAVTAYFSLEMSKEQLTDRLLCGTARIDAQRFRQGYLNRDDWSRLAQARASLENLFVLIDDTPSLTVMQLRAKARRIAASQKRLDLIIVDYLNLMKGRKCDSAYQELYN